MKNTNHMDNIVGYSHSQNRNCWEIALMIDNVERVGVNREAMNYPDMLVAYFACNHKWNRSMNDIVAF